jgi:hypothetical protein
MMIPERITQEITDPLAFGQIVLVVILKCNFQAVHRDILENREENDSRNQQEK